jgi:hypothetical protein
MPGAYAVGCAGIPPVGESGVKGVKNMFEGLVDAVNDLGDFIPLIFGVLILVTTSLIGIGYIRRLNSSWGPDDKYH